MTRKTKAPRAGYILDPFRGEKRVLYAVAVELWRGGRWSAHIHYVHAHTAREAKRFFLHTKPGLGRFVAVGPAVGFFALDEHGEQLSADPYGRSFKPEHEAWDHTAESSAHGERAA